jgi:Ca2+-binding RTX toxin-like protein
MVAGAPVCAGRGADLVQGSGGADVIDGGMGADILSGAGGAGLIQGSGGMTPSSWARTRAAMMRWTAAAARMLSAASRAPICCAAAPARPGPVFLGTDASQIHGEDGADILRLNVSHAGQIASGGVRCRLPGGRAGAATRTEILDFVPGIDTLRFDGIKIDPWSPRAGAIWR